MQKWKIYSGLIVLFLSGVVVGAVCSGMIIHQLASSFMDEHGDHPVKRMILTNIDHRLKVDDATRARIGEEIDATLEEVKALRESLKPKVDDLVQRFLQRTATFLDESQQAELTALLDDFKHRRHDKLKGPGWFLPPPPPPPLMDK